MSSVGTKFDNMSSELRSSLGGPLLPYAIPCWSVDLMLCWCFHFFAYISRSFQTVWQVYNVAHHRYFSMLYVYPKAVTRHDTGHFRLLVASQIRPQTLLPLISDLTMTFDLIFSFLRKINCYEQHNGCHILRNQVQMDLFNKMNSFTRSTWYIGKRLITGLEVLKCIKLYFYSLRTGVPRFIWTSNVI